MTANVEFYKRRCAECPNCKVVKGVWHCTELFEPNDLCSEVGEDECPEGITMADVVEMEKPIASPIPRGKATPSAEKKERKPRERKPDEEKESLIAGFAEYLASVENVENVTISNKSKVVEFTIGENSYKIDLIRKRKPKE